MTRSPLSPCPACARHVRVNATSCPFCGVAFEAAPGAVVPAMNSTAGGVTRAAIFAFATSLAASCASSQSTTENTVPRATSGTSAEQNDNTGNATSPTTGAPLTPAVPPTTTDTSDGGTMMALYGAPAIPPGPTPMDGDAGTSADAGTARA